MTHINETDIYRAIADPNRRKLLDLLMEEERPVQALLPHMDITFGAVSQHLQILLRNGLVEREKRGRYRIYRVRPDALQDIDAWMHKYRRFWKRRLDNLGDYLDKGS